MGQICKISSGIPEAEIFGGKRKFSAFGLRFWQILRLKMAECQIAEFFLNGLSPHLKFDDSQKKKMPSTPSKTNCQANYFGSKVVPTEFT